MASPRELSPSEQQQIQQWISAHGTPQQVALRCRIVLASSQGLSDVAIAKQFSINRKTVILWRKRFAQQRLDGLWAIAPGRGRKPDYDIDKISAIVDATLQTKEDVQNSVETRGSPELVVYAAWAWAGGGVDSLPSWSSNFGKCR